MKSRIVLTALAVLTVFIVNAYANGPQELFDEGCRLYQQGKYREAADTFLSILSTGYENGALYYNIGNCYYKLQNTGKSILFYERARRLVPHDEDVRANLAMAGLSVVDKIEPAQEFILFVLARGYIHFIPHTLLVWIVVILYAGCIAWIILYMLSRRYGLRHLAMHMGIAFGVLFLIFGIALAGQWIEDARHDEAIILATKVDVVSAPSETDGMEVFSIHEGTRVRLDQKSGDWIEIILADGKVGWVKKDVLEVI